jgi:hypothetical protein
MKIASVRLSNLVMIRPSRSAPRRGRLERRHSAQGSSNGVRVSLLTVTVGDVPVVHRWISYLTDLCAGLILGLLREPFGGRSVIIVGRVALLTTAVVRRARVVVRCRRQPGVVARAARRAPRLGLRMVDRYW